MFTTKIDDTTLAHIVSLGNQIADSVDKLENLIWLVKAQAVAQLAEATRAYTEAYEKNSTNPELTENVRKAADRLAALDKLWSSEVAMRNRAVQFGNLDGRRVPGYLALEEVMKIVLEARAAEVSAKAAAPAAGAVTVAPVSGRVPAGHMLDIERSRGTKPEFTVVIDQAFYQGKDSSLTTVDAVVQAFRTDLADWLTANNEWGNLHVVSALPYMACILVSCQKAVADKLSASMSGAGVSQVQEFFEK